MIPRRVLGRTGLNVPVCSLGCGPIPQRMTGKRSEEQLKLLSRAIAVGIDWVDTAASYGDGSSERNLGWALSQVDVDRVVRVATKVRLMPDQLHDIPGTVRASVESSLQQLGLEQLVLLQLHNSITAARGDEATSLSTQDVLASGGVLETMQQLQQEGIVKHIGITGLGQSQPMKAVIASGQFDTIQVPLSLVNWSAGAAVAAEYPEADHGRVIQSCGEQEMGVFVIRVFAGGALLGHPPAPHTLTTRFFPLDLYMRDRQRAESMRQLVPGTMDEAAIRFSAFHSHVSSAIVGMSELDHIDRALAACEKGPLPKELVDQLLALAVSSPA